MISGLRTRFSGPHFNRTVESLNEPGRVRNSQLWRTQLNTQNVKRFMMLALCALALVVSQPKIARADDCTEPCTQEEMFGCDDACWETGTNSCGCFSCNDGTTAYECFCLEYNGCIEY